METFPIFSRLSFFSGRNCHQRSASHTINRSVFKKMFNYSSDSIWRNCLMHRNLDQLQRILLKTVPIRITFRRQETMRTQQTVTTSNETLDFTIHTSSRNQINTFHYDRQSTSPHHLEDLGIWSLRDCLILIVNLTSRFGYSVHDLKIS